VPFENSVSIFNTKLGVEDIFNPIIVNESLHQECNDDDDFRVVNFAT